MDRSADKSGASMDTSVMSADKSGASMDRSGASADRSVVWSVAPARKRLSMYCLCAYLLKRRLAINNVAIVRGASRTAAARDVIPPRRHSAHV